MFFLLSFDLCLCIILQKETDPGEAEEVKTERRQKLKVANERDKTF